MKSNDSIVSSISHGAGPPSPPRQRLLRLGASLAFKLALSLLILTVLTTVLILWRTEQDTYLLLLDFGKAQARIFLSDVEEHIEINAPDLDPGQLQPIIAHFMSEAPGGLDFRIEHLFVADRDGKIIATNRNERLGTTRALDPVLARAVDENRMAFSEELNYRQPATSNDARLVPTMDVVMPLHSIRATWPTGLLGVELDLSASAEILRNRYWGIRRDLLANLGLLIGGFGVLSFVVVRRQIIRPVIEMARVAQSISNGDLRRRIPSRGDDEIGALANALNQMTDSLQATIADLKRTEIVAMTKLTELAETRDPDTGAHLQRIPGYCRVLAEALRRDPTYADQLDDEYIQTLLESCVLHDIGKVAIPDTILLKPGPLDADEFAVMRQHALAGADVLSGAEFLDMAREMALCHHERYDGAGYPRGLSGEQIPLAARIVALADMYDALTSRRVYKEAYSHEKAFALIREPVSHETASALLAEESGRHFDPHVMEAFLGSEHEFRKIREQFAD
ncbi:MAG: HAMP domain-containing protein [Chloroflexi bacterium]|nr:HAMP domain-containing protein [Chloroflexota bacterium]